MTKLNIIKLTAVVGTILFLGGCSSKITIMAIKPSKVDDKSIKNISIENFQNDNISLSSNIEASMNKVQFNGKKYFNIANRKESSTILKEQKLQDSGLVDTTTQKNYGLQDTSSIVTGKVNFTNFTKNSFYETRTDYDTCIKYKNSKKKYCEKYRKYKVFCTNHNYSVDATITISKIVNATVLFKENYNKQKTIKKCSDQSTTIAHPQSIFTNLGKQITYNFVSNIAPSYINQSVVLLDDEDIDYNDTEENLLENGLKMLKHNHIKESQAIFQKLVNSTKSKSSTALYNLAVTYEYFNNLDKASILYKKAYEISILNEIDENILLAIKRVEKNILNKNIANKQIN